MEIPKKKRQTIFENLVPIFKLAISQPIQYVNRYLASVSFSPVHIKIVFGLVRACGHMTRLRAEALQRAGTRHGHVIPQKP
jgi:hypothetical protein